MQNINRGKNCYKTVINSIMKKENYCNYPLVPYDVDYFNCYLKELAVYIELFQSRLLL